MRAVEGTLHVYVICHGKAKAKASQEFMNFVQTQNPSLFEKLTQLGTLSLTRMSDGEIFKEAHHRWSVLLR